MKALAERMMEMPVLEKNALDVVREIRRVYSEPDAQMKIMTSEEYTGGEGGQVIAWSEGPEEWAIVFSAMAGEKRLQLDEWLFVEPVNDCVLGVYER